MGRHFFHRRRCQALTTGITRQITDDSPPPTRTAGPAPSSTRRRVDFAKFQPIVYDSTLRIYRAVGEEVGGAWEAGKVFMG